MNSAPYLEPVDSWEAPAPGDKLLAIETEYMLVGLLLTDNYHVDRVADVLSPPDFGSALMGRMFDLIVQEVARGHRVTGMTLWSHFSDDEELGELGGKRFVANLSGTYAAALMDLSEAVRIIRDLADRRRMRAGLRAAAEALEDVRRPVAEVSAEADAAIAARADAGIEETDARETMEAALAALERGVEGVTCRRIAAVDDLMGPIEPKSLIIVAGRPGMGKTAFASSYALGAANAGHGVLIVSLEMSRDQLAHRMLADEGFDDPEMRVGYTQIQQRSLNAREKHQVHVIGAHIGTLPLTIVDAGALNVDQLDRMVRRHRRRFAARGKALALVVIDYLQLVQPSSRKLSTYEAISEVSRRLKAMAKQNGVAVMALAQLTRGVEQRPDKRPQLSDLRDSGQIEQDADAVLFLYREEYYVRQAEPRDDPDKRAEWEAKLERCRGAIDFLLPKRRNGPSGVGQGRFFAPYQAVR